VSDANLFTVKILDKEYRVACERGEQENLLRAARHLDERMREIRSKGKVLGGERIAVMAALNISHEYLQQDTEGSVRRREIETRLRSLQEKIEHALHQHSQLEV